jgi:hypothetical protein
MKKLLFFLVLFVFLSNTGLVQAQQSAPQDQQASNSQQWSSDSLTIFFLYGQNRGRRFTGDH